MSLHRYKEGTSGVQIPIKLGYFHLENSGEHSGFFIKCLSLTAVSHLQGCEYIVDTVHEKSLFHAMEREAERGAHDMDNDSDPDMPALVDEDSIDEESAMLLARLLEKAKVQ